MVPNPLQELLAWVANRARLMATKAPKDSPFLFIAVLLLGILLLLVYAATSQLDMGIVVFGVEL